MISTLTTRTPGTPSPTPFSSGIVWAGKWSGARCQAQTQQIYGEPQRMLLWGTLEHGT